MLTLPRKLSLQNGKVIQNPIVNVGELQAVEMSENFAIENLDTAYLQISVENQPLVLDFSAMNRGKSSAYVLKMGC